MKTQIREISRMSGNPQALLSYTKRAIPGRTPLVAEVAVQYRGEFGPAASASLINSHWQLISAASSRNSVFSF
jgi:hypothetical protein